MALTNQFFSENYSWGSIVAIDTIGHGWSLVFPSGSDRPIKTGGSTGGSASFGYPANSGGTVGTQSIYLNSAVSPTADMRVSTNVIRSGSGNSGSIFLVLRGTGTSPTDAQFYALKVSAGLGNNVLTFQIQKLLAGGSLANVGSSSTVTVAANTNVLIDFSVVGNALVGKSDGVTIVSSTDSSIVAAGRPGLGADAGSGSSSGVGFSPTYYAYSDVAAPDLSGSATLGDITASGTLAPAPDSGVSGSATLGDIAAAGSLGVAPGTITTPVLKNNTGTVLASVSGVVANIYNPSTGALVVRKTGLSSNGSGIVTITDAALVPGTSYVYEIDLSSASLGRRLPVGVAA